MYRTAATYKGTVPYDYIDHAMELGVTEIHLRYDTCTVQRIRDIHAAGFTSMAWFRGPQAMTTDLLLMEDVESEQHLYELVAQTGVQQLCINRPKLAMEITI